MASSRVMATTSSANSDLARQPSPLLYSLSPVVPVGGSSSDLQITARALGPIGSMNMEEILRNMYATGGGVDVASPAAVGEVVPYCGGAAKTEDEEVEERRAADDVWREISGRDEKIGNGVNGVGGASSAVYPLQTEMTLEDFLTRAGMGVGVEVVTDDDVRVAQGMVPPPQPPVEGSMLGMVVDSVLAEQFPQPMPQPPQQGGAVEGAFVGFTNEVEGGAGGGGRSKRRTLLEPEDKIQQQRQRRMIKNRESAARSRERKQAYTVELEKTVTQLEEENMRLRAQQEEARKNRLKQLLEALVPVTEKRMLTPAPSKGLRRTFSM